jgi:hypothetical protein
MSNTGTVVIHIREKEVNKQTEARKVRKDQREST